MGIVRTSDDSCNNASDRRADGRDAGSRAATARILGHRKNQPSVTPTNRQNAALLHEDSAVGRFGPHFS